MLKVKNSICIESEAQKQLFYRYWSLFSFYNIFFIFLFWFCLARAQLGEPNLKFDILIFSKLENESDVNIWNWIIEFWISEIYYWEQNV